jgi:hypothetical protein
MPVVMGDRLMPNSGRMKRPPGREAHQGNDEGHHHHHDLRKKGDLQCHQRAIGQLTRNEACRFHGMRIEKHGRTRRGWGLWFRCSNVRVVSP